MATFKWDYPFRDSPKCPVIGSIVSLLWGRLIAVGVLGARRIWCVLRIDWDCMDYRRGIGVRVRRWDVGPCAYLHSPHLRCDLQQGPGSVIHWYKIIVNVWNYALYRMHEKSRQGIDCQYLNRWQIELK